jgi:hypothetical protein
MSAGNAICSVTNYILAYHKNFDELMKNVCRSRLASTRSDNGLTFVVPDSDTVDKYLNLVKKASAQDLIDMQSFCEKHFLLGNVKKYSGASIVDASGKHLSINGTTLSDGTNSVELKEVDVSFPSRRSKDKDVVPNISIYKQANSSNGIHKLKGSDSPMTKSSTTTKKGGALYTRNDIIKNVMYSYCINQTVHKNHSGFLNPFLEAVNSLLLCVRKHNNNLYKNLLMIKDVSPEINFFMLVKAFGNNKEVLISDDIIKKWGGSLFDYKPKTLNRLFDEEAHRIISSHKDLIELRDRHDGTEEFYNKLSSITGFSVEVHKSIDKFRSMFRKKLFDMIKKTEPLLELKEICDDIQMNTSSAINIRIMGGMEATGSCCYLNDYMDYDESSGAAVSVDSLPKITNDNSHSEHFIEGFRMLNGR